MSNPPEEKKPPEAKPEDELAEIGEETLDDVTSLSREDLKIRPPDKMPRDEEEEEDADVREN